MDDRAGAWIQITAYEREAGLLREKITLAENDLQVLYDARNEAVTSAQNAIMGKANLMAAVASPFTHSLAFQTETYKMYRSRLVWKVLLLGDRKDPQRDQAIDQLREWCKMTGYRTENDPLIDSDAEATRKLWESYRDEKLEHATVQPSAQDVIHAEETIIRRAAEDARWNDRVEDMRGIRKPRRVDMAEYRRR